MKILARTLLSLVLISINLFFWSKAFEPLPSKKAATATEDKSVITNILGSKLIEQIKPSPTPSQNLEKIVAKALEGSTGHYSVYIKHLKTGENYGFKENDIFDSGSLYKLWVMGETYKQIEEGLITEDQKLSQSIATLNQKFSIDPELAEQTEGGITLTVKQSLEQMITISHNYAALLLTEKLKLSQVASYLEENQLNFSSVGTTSDPPRTTAKDTYLFLEKLYDGKLANADNTQKMIELLKRQRLNNKLPLFLPDSVKVAHKTGEIGMFSHDGGIVFSGNGDYIIVVLSESKSPKGAEERIGKISKGVFDYFQNQ